MKKHWHINWDAMGITTSVLCAIHCALLPIAVAALPVFGVDIIHHPVFEYGMILLAFGIGTWAMWHGFRRHHQRLTPWLIFVAGMVLLIAKQVWHRYELVILPFAAGSIILAHIVNFRLTRSHHGVPKDRSRLAPEGMAAVGPVEEATAA